jgi:hypothetical protein
MTVKEAEQIAHILTRILRARQYYLNAYQAARTVNFEVSAGQYSSIAAAYEHCHGLICHEFGLESPWPLDEELK